MAKVPHSYQLLTANHGTLSSLCYICLSNFYFLATVYISSFVNFIAEIGECLYKLFYQYRRMQVSIVDLMTSINYIRVSRNRYRFLFILLHLNSTNVELLGKKPIENYLQMVEKAPTGGNFILSMPTLTQPLFNNSAATV